MKWNFYYTATAIVIQIILLWFYRYSNVLPLPKNKIFYRILSLSVVTCFLNLVGVWINTKDGFHYNPLLPLICVLYYALFIYVFYKIFEYGMFYLGFEESLKRHQILYRIPMILFLIFGITSFWTHYLFYIDFYGNFAYGQYYTVFYVVLAFYSLLLFYYQRKVKDRLPKVRRTPINVCLFTLALGILCDYVSHTAILTDIFLSTSELILYITLENPDFYRSHITKTYNTEAFVNFTDELLKKKIPFSAVGFRINNLPNLKRHHGTRNLFSTMMLVGKWFKDSFPSAYVFYPDNDCFFLLSETPIDEKRFVALCRKRFIRPFKHKDISLFIHGNMFTVDHPEKFSSASEILCAASVLEESLDLEVLYRITEEDREAILREATLEAVLQKHISENTIDVYYQPLYAVKSGKIEGAEALARLTDAHIGPVPPGIFIPLAEKNGTIMDLGLQIFEKICLFVSQTNLEAAGIRTISINLSPIQFQDMRLSEALEKIAQKYKVDFSVFNFEITETALSNNELVESQIAHLKKRGAHVSLDDFGTGSSNLARLTRFPFTESKLDMSLVWNYFETRNPIMKDVITIFKNQGLKIVAEGVETKEMAMALSGMNCDYLQGYYFSKPLPEEDFCHFISTFNAK